MGVAIVLSVNTNTRIQTRMLGLPVIYTTRSVTCMPMKAPMTDQKLIQMA